MYTVLKRILKVCFGLILVLAILLIAAFFCINSIVKQSINTGAPKLLGINTHVDGVNIKPLSGTIHLQNLTLANPDGYTQDKYLFAVNEFYISINMASIFSDTIKIHKILIKAPGCTYEIKKGISNIDALIAKLNKAKSAQQVKGSEPQAPRQLQEKKVGKKVIIDEIYVNDTKIAYASTVTAGQFLTIPIVSITLKDIGKKNGGETFGDALTQIMNALLSSVTSAISGLGDLAGSTAKGATDAAKASSEALDAGVKDTAKAVGSALDEVGGLFKSKKK
ncbi:MAG: AsmA family protein [bacterium]